MIKLYWYVCRGCDLEFAATDCPNCHEAGEYTEAPITKENPE